MRAYMCPNCGEWFGSFELCQSHMEGERAMSESPSSLFLENDKDDSKNQEAKVGEGDGKRNSRSRKKQLPDVGNS